MGGKRLYSYDVSILIRLLRIRSTKYFINQQFIDYQYFPEPPTAITLRITNDFLIILILI